jgi:hypothetical protein
MDDLNAWCKSPHASADAGEADAKEWSEGVRARWTALAKLVLPHLDEEEEMICPVMRDNFTPEEYGPVVAKIQTSLGDDAQVMLAPMAVSISDWSPSGYARMLSNLPPQVSEALTTDWIPKWRSEWEAVCAIRGAEASESAAESGSENDEDDATSVN